MFINQRGSTDFQLPQRVPHKSKWTALTTDGRSRIQSGKGALDETTLQNNLSQRETWQNDAAMSWPSRKKDQTKVETREGVKALWKSRQESHVSRESRNHMYVFIREIFTLIDLWKYKRWKLQETTRCVALPTASPSNQNLQGRKTFSMIHGLWSWLATTEGCTTDDSKPQGIFKAGTSLHFARVNIWGTGSPISGLLVMRGPHLRRGHHSMPMFTKRCNVTDREWIDHTQPHADQSIIEVTIQDVQASIAAGVKHSTSTVLTMSSHLWWHQTFYAWLREKTIEPVSFEGGDWAYFHWTQVMCGSISEGAVEYLSNGLL